MLTKNQFNALKKGSITGDIEKTKARIPESFKSASKEQKEEILKLSGYTSANNFYGIAKTGSAPPRAVLSLAQVLNVSPEYLVGIIDEKAECDDKTLTALFKKYSMDAKPNDSKPDKKPVKEKAAKVKAAAKKAEQKTEKVVKQVAKPVKEAAVKAVKPIQKAVNTPVQRSSVKIDDESLLLLLDALSIRAKFNKEASETYEKIKALLTN